MMLLFFFFIVWMIGLIIGRETSYAPGPGYSKVWVFFFFLPRGDTEPKGAYDWEDFDDNDDGNIPL
jgi:hypothetical protein